MLTIQIFILCITFSPLYWVTTIVRSLPTGWVQIDDIYSPVVTGDLNATGHNKSSLLTVGVSTHAVPSTHPSRHFLTGLPLVVARTIFSAAARWQCVHGSCDLKSAFSLDTGLLCPTVGTGFWGAQGVAGCPAKHQLI